MIHFQGASPDTHSVYAVMFTSPSVIGNANSMYFEPDNVKENIANIGIKDLDQCCILTFYPQYKP